MTVIPLNINFVTRVQAQNVNTDPNNNESVYDDSDEKGPGQQRPCLLAILGETVP